MPTLAELTLELSKSLTRLEQERRAAIATLDREQLEKLMALPGADDAMEDHQQDLLKAEAARDKELLDIQLDLEQAERKARRQRDEAIADVQRRFEAAERAAQAQRTRAEDNARAAYEKELARIDESKLLPGQKVLSRAEARRVLQEALEAAREAFTEAQVTNRQAQQEDYQAALAREAEDSAANRADADARRRDAARVFGLAVTVADRRMRAALGTLPGAAEIERDAAARRTAIEQDFKQRESELFAAFQRAKRELPAVG